MQPEKKILAVDDSPMNIAIVQKMLGGEYCVKAAINGEEALEMAREFKPDIALLDIMMPGIDGYEVCRRIRADRTMQKMKIIMISAKAMLSERLDGYAAGADDYITKPFEEAELLAKIRVYLRLKSVEEVDQLRTGVLSLLGHEMQTRINGILSPATILMSDDELDVSERKMLADMVYRNVKRLHILLEEVVRSQGCEVHGGQLVEGELHAEQPSR